METREARKMRENERRGYNQNEKKDEEKGEPKEISQFGLTVLRSDKIHNNMVQENNKPIQST